MLLLLRRGTARVPLDWTAGGRVLLYHANEPEPAAVAFDPAADVEVRYLGSAWIGSPVANEIVQLRNACDLDGPWFTLYALDLQAGTERELAPGEDGSPLLAPGPQGRLRASRPGELWLFDLAIRGALMLGASRGVEDYYPEGHWAGGGRWFVFHADGGHGRCE